MGFHGLDIVDLVVVESGQLLFLEASVLYALAQNVLEAGVALLPGASPLIPAEIAPAFRKGADFLLIGDVAFGVDVDIGSSEVTLWEIFLLDNGDSVHGVVDPPLPLATMLGLAPTLMLRVVAPGFAGALLADQEPFL